MEDVAKINDLKLDDGQKNEGRNALLKAGPKLYNFITKGGKIDTSRETDGQKAIGNFQLETKYKEVYKLNDRVQKLLTARSEKEKKEQKPKEGEQPQILKKTRKISRKRKSKKTQSIDPVK